jgi:ParB-like chromosome segregation protein Spo0J
VNIRNRVKSLRIVPANELRPNPKNWRTHPKAQADALRGVLAEVGMADACLARELPDGSLMLIDGHLRAETAANAKVPVLILDVTEAEADKILATLDPLAAMAEKDAEQLASLLGTLKEQNDNLAALVWPDYIIDPLLSADWTPQDLGDEPTETATMDQKSKQDALHLTAEQRETINAAIAKCREFNEANDLTDAQCVELICQEYLAT